MGLMDYDWEMDTYDWDINEILMMGILITHGILMGY